MSDQALPQLSFALNNPGATDTVYISTDASDNQLTLVVTANASGSFTSGTPVAIADAGTATCSLLYLDLTNLNLTSDELQGITLADSVTGWAAQAYPSDNMVCFAPTAAASIGSSGSITIALAGFTMATAPSTLPAQLNVVYFRVGGITQQSNPLMGNFSVAVQNPPDKHDKDLHKALQISVSPNAVVNSIDGYPTIENQLVLQFGPGSDAVQVPAGDSTQFVLSFVYASDTNGFGALMTPAQAQPPFAVTTGVGADGWQVTPDLGAQSPSWELTPTSGQPIVPAQGTVSFNIQNLVTNFQPGPTLILVSYTGVPGYKSGTFSIMLEKVGHVALTAQTDKQQYVLVNGTAQVTLSWNASYATSIILNPLGLDVTNFNPPQYTTQILQTTQFSFNAEGGRPGNVDNIAIVQVTADVIPVINSFLASPSAIYKGDFPYNVNLAWNVNTNGQVRLSSSASQYPDPNFYAAVGALQKPIATPQMLTLTPVEPPASPAVSRSVMVSGFDISLRSWNNGLAGAYVAAPPNADFVAMSVPNSSQVAILSTANFQPLTNVTVGLNPQGVAFSADGSTMYVANQGDGTVSVIGVANISAPNPYSFTTLATVKMGGEVAPNLLTVGPDGTVWATVSAGGNANGSVVGIKKGTTGTYTTTTVAVGVNPTSAAVTPSGGVLFVANQGSNSVSVISLGQPPVPGTPITMTQPFTLAVSPDGSKLIVACTDSKNSVYVYNIAHAPVLQQTFHLPGMPAQIGMFPGGAYAVVTCPTTNQAVLLNYDSGSTAATPVTLSGSPGGVAITPDNGMAIVVPIAGGVEVVTFVQYAQQAGLPACGGMVTGVALTPDGSSAIAWYDSLISLQVQGAPAPLKGLAICQTTGAVTTALPGTAVIDVAVSPGANDNLVYVISLGLVGVAAYQTSTKTITTLPINPKGHAAHRQPVALALSRDGTRLFVLTADGGNVYSVVAFQASASNLSFNQMADVTLFTAQSYMLYNLIAAAPDGSAVYAIDDTTGKFYGLQQSAGTYQLTQSALTLASGTPAVLALLPDGSAAYVLVKQNIYNVVCIVDPAGWTSRAVYLADSSTTVGISDMVASPDGSKLIVADGLANGIRILDAASLRIIQTITWTAGVQFPYGIAVSPDGSQIYTANALSANLAIAQQVQPG